MGPSGATRPLVSVVIPAFNAARTLPRQLAALAGQRDAPRFEVVLADNGSSDGTQSLVPDWVDELDIRLVDASSRRGASYARNVGGRAAFGEKILFCDADDVVSPLWVQLMSTALDRGRVLVSGPIVRVTKAQPVGWTPTDPTFGANLSSYMGLMPCVLAGSMGIWKQDYISVGGYDNSYRGGCEDVDFSWRAQFDGMEAVVATGCYLYYRPRVSAWAVFKQERRYTSQGILLWVRFKDQPGISGPSLRWTIQAVIRGVFAARPVTLRHHDKRYAWAQRLGSDLGSLEGHIRYRVLRMVPDRQLLSGAAAKGANRS